MTTNIKRAYNFNAGPAAIPLPVLQKAQGELLNFNNTGMSVMELSHRGKDYEDVHNQAIASLKELMGISNDYEVLFLQGGASLQFAMVPMNFLAPDKKAGYLMTGVWSEKALDEAKLFGNTYEIASSKGDNFSSIPALDALKYDNDTAYVHLTSNNTIYGTQWQMFPDAGNIPLIADMSSDILSRPFDVNKFSLIYAGAQKNLGPSGVTLVIIHKSMLEKVNKQNPKMLRYDIHAKNNSLYNTPPTFGIYMLKLVLDWVKEAGGVHEIYKRNLAKAALIYDTIDASNGFYSGHAKKDARSSMNITFRLASEELENKFLAEVKKAGFVGLNGHRSVGGCRASAYNAVPYEACAALKDFMLNFQKANG